jgi:succinoglycan biosynthesis transport protein ExoP
MEIKDFLLMMWRGFRFLVLGVILGLALGWGVSQIQTPVYEATTEVLVSRARQQSTTDMLPLSEDQLVSTNIELVKSQPVLDAASSQLGSKIIADDIKVSAIPNTLIIQIKARNQDPQRAAETANTLVQILIQQNENLLSGRYSEFENTLDTQISQVQNQIADLQDQISQINDASVSEQLTQVNQQIEQLIPEIASLETDINAYPVNLTTIQRASLGEKQARLEQLRSLLNLYQQIQTSLTFIGKPGQTGLSRDDPRLANLESTLNLYQQLYLSLVNNRENVNLARTQNTPNLAQINPAIPPKDPVHPLPLLYTLLGGVVGLFLSAATILTLDSFNDSLKTVSQTEETLGLPVLATVSNKNRDDGRLVTLYEPLTEEAEAFRSLGICLELADIEKSIHTLLVTNADPGVRKTSIAANLAIVNAQLGKRVILVDGDLGHPHLHRLFRVENQAGMANILEKDADIKIVGHSVEGVPGMTLIPSGAVTEIPISWLDRESWASLLIKLQQQGDMVIVDGPSAELANAQMLASKVDAVLLVVCPGHTRIDSAQAALRRFRLMNTRVAGVVLDRNTRGWFPKTRILRRAKTTPRK